MTDLPDFGDDQPVLDALGIGPGQLLGWGGEARVYGYGPDKIARILHPSGTQVSEDIRVGLAQEIHGASTHLDFATTHVLDTRLIETRIVSIEQRFSGTPLSQLLSQLQGPARAEHIRALMDAAAQISSIDIRRDTFCDLRHDEPLSFADYRSYLYARTATHLANAPRQFDHISAQSLVDALPVPAEKSLVHMDLFPANILFEQGRVRAIIDFGASMIGDKRMELWATAAYLDTALSPDATNADRAVATDWLSAHGLIEAYPAARRWLVAFWAYAHDDPKVLAWSESILLD